VGSKTAVFSFGGILAILFISGTQDQTFAQPFRWASSVGVGQRYDDNIYLVRKDQTSDFVTLITPRFGISSTEGKANQDFQYRAQIERYESAEELNTVKHFGILNWTSRIKESGSLVLTDRFSFTPDSTDISSVGAVIPRGKAYGNESTVSIKIPWTNLSYQYDLRSYEAAELIDAQTHILEERLAVPLFSARQELTQIYRFRYFLQDGTAGLDSQNETWSSHNAGAGLQYYFSPTLLMGAEGGVVYWQNSGDSSSEFKPTFSFNLRKDFKHLKLSFSWMGDIEAQVRGNARYEMKRTVFTIDYSKYFTLYGGTTEGVVDRQVATIDLQHTMGRRTSFTLGTTFGTEKPIGASENQIVTLRESASLAYTFRPWLSGGIHYNYFRQDSNDPFAREFTRNQLYMVLTSSMP
jgi:hypothetical protein